MLLEWCLDLSRRLSGWVFYRGSCMARERIRHETLLWIGGRKIPKLLSGCHVRIKTLAVRIRILMHMLVFLHLYLGLGRPNQDIMVVIRCRLLTSCPLSSFKLTRFILCFMNDGRFTLLVSLILLASALTLSSLQRKSSVQGHKEEFAPTTPSWALAARDVSGQMNLFF